MPGTIDDWNASTNFSVEVTVYLTRLARQVLKTALPFISSVYLRPRLNSDRPCSSGMLKTHIRPIYGVASESYPLDKWGCDSIGEVDPGKASERESLMSHSRAVLLLRSALALYLGMTSTTLGTSSDSEGGSLNQRYNNQ